MSQLNQNTTILQTLLEIIRSLPEAISVDSALSATSTNPVQNKVVTTALDGKANSSHEHAADDITEGTFAGQVFANAFIQTPGTSLLRNSKIVSTETNPSNNGEIVWNYE